MVLAVTDPLAAIEALTALGETAYVIGHIEAAEGEPTARIDLPSDFFRMVGKMDVLF
jgi:hypothetical protein